MVTAEIITIGDEILIGQVIDSNSAWIAKQLNSYGISVSQITSISDTTEAITNAIDNASGKNKIVLLTGGLGPTKDDITKSTLAKYFNCNLVRNNEVLEDIKSFLSYRSVGMNELNEKQADVPDKCSIFRNKYGTAPGMCFENNDSVIISMPGVPHEMKGIMKFSVLPYLKSRYKTPIILHKTVLVPNVPESHLATKLESWENNLPEHLKLAYLPSPGLIRLRFSMIGDSKQEMETIIDSEIKKLYKIIPDNITGIEEEDLENRVASVLKKNDKTIATAESCTGGNIAKLLTSISGSSVN